MFNKQLMLDSDFLMNELGLQLGLSASVEQAKFKEYFLNICNAISEVFYLKPSFSEIDSYILEGEYYYTTRNKVFCPVKTVADRIYLFRYAQALQLKYDLYGGRANMIRGEDSKTNLCKDAIQILDQLGLYQRTFMTR